MNRFALFTALLLVSAPAMAQQDPESQFFDHGTGYVNEAAELDRLRKKLSMAARSEINPTEVHVSLVQEDYMEQGDQFAIMLTVPDVISGCYELTPLEYEASFIDPYYLDIKVKHYRRDLIDSDQPHLDCPGTYSRAEAMIPLSKRDLLSRGTKQIKFRTDTITEFYDLDITDNEVTLRPQSMAIFKADVEWLSRTLVYDMKNSSKVQLYVPMAQADDDLMSDLKQFAQTRGLTPIEQGRMNASDPKNIIIVEDSNGNLVNSLKETEVEEVGSIAVKRQVRGENGIQDTSVPLTVFAKPL